MLPVIGKMWPPGLAMVLASSGFGTIAAFLALRYAALGWDGAGFALTGFGALYILSRLCFAGLPDRFGGIKVAMVCLVGEAIGLVLIAAAPSPAIAFCRDGDDGGWDIRWCSRRWAWRWCAGSRRRRAGSRWGRSWRVSIWAWARQGR